MRAAIYLRVSTSDGRQDTNNQKYQLEEFVRQQEGWELYKIYKDQKSGKNDRRDAFQQMLDDARNNRFDVLCFWALDRLSREGTLATLKHLDLLSSLQIRFISYTEKYIDTSGIFKDVIISMLATLAKQERIRLSERTRAGLQEFARKGEPGPKGYLRGGRPNKAFDAKKAARMRSEGASYQAIADALKVSKSLVINKFKNPALRINASATNHAQRS